MFSCSLTVRTSVFSAAALGLASAPAMGAAEACCIPNQGGSHLNPTCVMTEPDFCRNYGSDPPSGFGRGEPQGSGTNCVDDADSDDVAEECEYMMPGGNARAGTDLFTSVAGTRYDLQGAGAIVADFFGPGSDPFDGIIYFVGDPFDPSGPLGMTDTIVRRIDDAILPNCESGPVVVIPIEIVALSLRSVEPITVTYNGGLNPEAWDVHVCLSDFPQGEGQMTIQQCLLDGGVASWSFPLQRKFVFTRVGLPSDVRILDTGAAGMEPVMVSSGIVPWVYWDPWVRWAGPSIQVDGNCDGLPDAQLPETSNFVAGVGRMTCSCDPQTGPRQRDLLVNTLNWGEHILLPTASTAGGPMIPAVSEWSVAVLVLALLLVGTVFARKVAPPARGTAFFMIRQPR